MSAAAASETRRPWRFVGIDEATAGRRSGVVMAANEAAAVAAARLQGVIGAKVSKEASKSGTVRAKLSAGSSSERMAFLNSLALINSAVPSMSETMGIAAQQVPPRSRLRPAVEALLDATRGGGETLDRAFAAQGHVWGNDVAAVVAAGIRSGNLAEALRILAEHKERSDRIRRKVRRIFTKPIVSLIAVIAVLWLTMTVAVPQATEFAADVDVEIPALTTWSIQGGDFLNQWGLMLSVIAAASVMALYFLHQSDKHGTAVSHILLRAPVTGKIIHGQATALAAGVIAVALTAGSKAYEAVEWASAAVANRRVKHSLETVRQRLDAGEEFSEAAEREIPILPHEMAALARQSYLGIEDAGKQWLRYAETVSHTTENRVDNLSESMSAVINIALVAVLGFASMAATMPMMSVLTEVIANPGA